MKAIVIGEFGGAEVLKYVDVPHPSIGDSQVLIRVEAVSVNFADIQTRLGKYHAAGQPPIIPGLDATGVIEAVGADVRSLSVGQRVIAFPKQGSYAEYVVADQELAFVVPERVDPDTAAACPVVSFTAYKLLADVARVQPGETVLIHAAAGGIGTTAIQLAKILGAARVIGTVGSERKASAALEAGADQVVCHENNDFAKEVNEATNGRGADVILDSISGKVGEKSLDCLAMFGRLVAFGNACGTPARFRTSDLHSSCRAVLGFSLGTTRNNRPALLRGAAEQVMGYLADGRLNIRIGKRLSLAEAAEAHRWIESRESTGKAVLKIAG